MYEHVLPVQLGIGMSRKTRRLTLSAMFIALSVIFLWIASIWPTGQLGLCAFASLFVAAAVVEMGIVPGIHVFIISAVLGFLILPNKSALLLYILFFGYYPIAKSIIEKINLIHLAWILKLALFNAVLTAIWFFIRGLLPSFSYDIPGADILVYLGGNAVFALFDYGYSKLIRFYNDNVSIYINKG